jgi:hypothetical protein
MDERNANIDLLFRNGLRDYEVLPPAEAWDNIRPAVNQKSHSPVLLRAAALIAVIVSTGFLTYMLTRNETEINNTITAFNVERSIPYTLKQNTLEQPVADPFIAKSDVQPSSTIIDQDIRATNGEIIPQGNIRINNIDLSGYDRSIHLSGIQELTFGLNNIKKEITVVNPLFIPELKQKPAPKWSVMAMASPTYFSGFSSGQSSQLISSEQPAISYTGGFGVSYKINKRLSVQTGVYYAELGREVNGINSFGGFNAIMDAKSSHSFEVLTSSGTVFVSNPDVYLAADPGKRVISDYNALDPNKTSLQYLNNNIIQNFSYLQMPVVLKYKFIDRSLDFNIMGGMSYDLLLDNSVYTLAGSEKYVLGTTGGLNQFTISSSLGMGMEYSFSKKISLNLEPTFRYYLNPFNGSSGARVHPYSFGVFSGFSYKF